MKSRILTATSLLALLPVLAMCIGCATSSKNKDSQTGQVELTIMSAPQDGTCVQISVTGTRSVERDFDVKPGQDTVLSLNRLPLGAVTVNANAFAGACASLTPASVPTWVGDPVTTTLFPGVLGRIVITLVRNGRLAVGVDFNDDPTSFFSPACADCLKSNCASALNGGCNTLTDTALEGPATGLPKAQLCNETLACTLATHCGKDDLSVCYCGAVPGTACTDDGAGDGPCKLVLDRAFEAVQPLDVPVRFSDPGFAGGVAMNLLQCVSDSCAGCL
jgi:hypothetical protein